MSGFLRGNTLRLLIKQNAILKPFNKNISTTTLCCKWRRTPSCEIEKNLLLKDNLPATYQLIYRAPMENYVNWTKNISTLTVSLISCLAAYQWATTVNYITFVGPLDLGTLVSHEDDLWYFLGGFMLINLAIRIFTAKYPLRIYKDTKNSYVAVYASQLPLGVVKHYFQRGQVAEYRNFLNPWQHIMYRLGNRSSMLLLDYFKTPSEFHELFQSE